MRKSQRYAQNGRRKARRGYAFENGRDKNLKDKISERAPFVAEEYKTKLKARIEEALKDVKYDEARLLNEVAFYTDKVNIDEELTRLGSHIEQFRTLIKTEGAGKKLDF